jgi:2-keto-4-pentenoate hydratase/2-oxohepta-3-ene-1,7-dioic acid hydratase in catechol pathway
MRFVVHEQDGPRLGMVGADGQSVLDLTGLAESAAARRALDVQDPMPASMDELLGLPRRSLDVLARLAATRDTLPGLPPMRLPDLRLRAPIGSLRRNLFCVGLNYAAHVDEGARMAGVPAGLRPPSEFAEFFTKPPSSVIGPADAIQAHASVTRALDYEAELAVVIGREGVNITPEQAMEHVFGYMVANDVTGRDLQFRHGQWFKGKSLDASCPLGPMLVHASAIQDPHQLDICCEVNGLRVQQASTAQMIHRIPSLIAQLSAGLRLLPGDVILTGTPSGVGAARQPPLWLQPGDEVICGVAGIGELRNRVAA